MATKGLNPHYLPAGVLEEFEIAKKMYKAKEQAKMIKPQLQPYEVKERLFHCTTNGHNKWWKIIYWKHGHHYRYYTQYGKIGSKDSWRGQSKTKDVSMYCQIETIVKKKLKDDYFELEPNTIGINIKSPEKQTAHLEKEAEELMELRLGDLE